MRLVLASANPDKAVEVRALLEAFEIDPRPADLGDIDETGETLEDNARLKALTVARVAGLPAVSDDTGLEVDALGGAPGVYSARYAGPDATYADNVARLMTAMEGVVDRRARFRTIAMVCWPDGRSVWTEGMVEGRIALVARGDSGFGYDPVFEPDEGGGLTFAEMGAAKHDVSHRGRAFRALAAKLTSL